MIWVLAAATFVASIPAGLRWLRVAQREHYLPGSSTRFAMRWWSFGPFNPALASIAVGGVVGSIVDARWGLLVAVAQVGPIGLGVRGRTSPLAWTPRLRRLTGLTAVLFLAAVAVGASLGHPVVIAASLLLLPALVDVAMAMMTPIEREIGDRWVDKAAGRLEESGAKIVAITGSYGKTTTKQYLHHLLSRKVPTVASPASFNNRMGLARAVNEHLAPGTAVFIAEMGTYGRGEIAELCRWIEPDVAAIVSIGPVHLERFRTEENIVEAKAEILDRAGTGVIAVDHPLLAGLVERRRDGMNLVTVSVEGGSADVTVDDGVVRISGEVLGAVPDGIFPTNLAVAVGIAGALGIAVEPESFATLPHADHRQSVARSPAGFTIIDDTFNSNPAGAERALGILSGTEGRKVVVTPGMVELGPLQRSENEAFARKASLVCDELIVVGGTNRKALLRGAERGGASVTVVADREEAVELVRASLGPGDAVLYENDLPDHYP